MDSIAFSCIVDRPRYLMAQCLVWAMCLLEIQKIAPDNIFVHAAGIAGPQFLPWLKSSGINVVHVAPIDPGAWKEARAQSTIETSPETHVQRIVDG